MARRSPIKRLAGRISYLKKKAGLYLPLIRENGIGLFLRLMFSEALVRRRTYTAKIEDIPIRFRSFSSDIQVINSWLRNDLAEQYDTAYNFEGIIIDAGGHIGMAAISFARRFPDRKIISLEPSQDNFALLQENTKSFANVTPINCAIGPSDGTAELIDASGNTDGFYVSSKPDRDGAELHGQAIEVVSVPSILKRFGADSISLFKIDIEGFEVELLSDKPGWINKVGLVAIELHERFKPGSTRA